MRPEPLHPSWGAEALWRELDPLLPGISVEVVARTESTNSQLLARVRGQAGRSEGGDTGTAPDAHGRRRSDTQPCLLVAEHQTHGRGRLGRGWSSRAGASLTFSLALALAPRDWSGLSLAVGVALADALDPTAADEPPHIGLKWPNDLWLLDAPGRGRKLGGVLIETVAVGDQRLCVVGVGLNVRPLTPRHASSGFACLHELAPDLTPPRALARIARPLAQALRVFEQEGFAAFAARFQARDLLRDQPVKTTADACREGIAEGVDARGALRVRTSDGLHLLSSGEVSVRLHDEDTASAELPAC